MADAIRALILQAIEAARYAAPLDGELSRDILAGSNVPLPALDFDSLAWMEFCISIEVNSGAELTPQEIDGMQGVNEIEAWIRNSLKR